jgi:methyl-accepting chemotaxis protein
VEKARIMRPVDEFLAMLEARTEREIVKASQRAESLNAATTLL